VEVFAEANGEKEVAEHGVLEGSGQERAGAPVGGSKQDSAGQGQGDRDPIAKNDEMMCTKRNAIALAAIIPAPEPKSP
jgi:hypothetical protein